MAMRAEEGLSAERDGTLMPFPLSGGRWGRGRMASSAGLDAEGDQAHVAPTSVISRTSMGEKQRL